MESLDNNKLENIIRKYMRKYNTPGLAISILKDDKVIYAKGFGSRDLKEFKPMDQHTLIGIGSITKSFTAFSILKLHEQGKLHIEDSVSKYLNVKPFSDHPDIKIFHLLSHSSGIPAADAGMTSFFYTWGDYSKVFPATSKEDFLAHVGEPEEYIIFKPGEKFFYNNDMFTCLSFIIEQLSGLSYAEFVQQEIFQPLEMTRAVYTREALLKDANHMIGYQPAKEGDKTVMKIYDVPIGGFVEAAGGIYVSMDEMMHYASCLLHKGSYKGKQVLKQDLIEQMWNPRIKAPYGYGPEAYYCLGLVKDQGYFENQTLIHHGGGMGTSCAFFGFIPESNIAVSVAQNSCTGPVSIYGRAAMALLLHEVVESKIKFITNSNLVEEVSGTYKSPINLYTFSVSLKGGAIYAEYEIDDGKFNVPIVITNVEELTFETCNGLAEKQQIINFYRNETTKKIEFVNLDRYLYKKVS